MIVTVKLPLVDAVQERVEVPEPVTLVEDKLQVIPLGGLLVVVKLTTVVSPLTAVIVIVEVPAWFTFTLTLVGFAVIVKS